MAQLINLTLLKSPLIPVEAEGINPENLTGKSKNEIEELPLYSGNRREKISDYFQVEILETQDKTEGIISNVHLAKVVLKGDLSKFKRIGQEMASGEMEIQGSVGFHTGAMMRGGTLHILGDTGDWLGAHMEGGKIIVEGSAGHFVGAAYRGKTQGMTGGMILIQGDAGQMLGSRMRAGIVAVRGNCGDAPGFKMCAGTLLIMGKTGIRVGAGMERGTIILFQPDTLLPTFYYNCSYSPTFWLLLYQELKSIGFALPDTYREASFKRYSGDALTGGKGEILTCQSY